MKSNKMYLILAILCVWLPMFMGAWDKDKPSSSTSLRNSNPQILANWSALETSFGAFHEFSTGGTNSGENVSIKFNAPISTPDDAANKGWLYEKDVSAVVELHWLDESDNELQMTSGGDLFSSTGLVVTGTSTFNGSATLGAGDDLIGSATSDITFNTDKFTVAGATGNTVVGGTLDVTGNIDPTTYETTNGGFLDEDDLSSDAADKVASQQSIKAYIAAQIAAIGGFQAPQLTDDGAAQLTSATVYKAITDGIVNAWAYSGVSGAEINGFVGATSNPTTAMGISGNPGVLYCFISFPVKKDYYWKITLTGISPTLTDIVWTPSTAGTATPEKQ